MVPVTSFGIVAFKKSKSIEPILSRIQAWSVASKVPVYFHPVLKNRLPPDANLCESEQIFLRKSRALISSRGRWDVSLDDPHEQVFRKTGHGRQHGRARIFDRCRG